MITPGYLEEALQQVVSLYQSLQETIIRDVVDRLMNTDFTVADTVKWRIEKLQQSGMVYDEVLRRLSEATGRSEAELKRIFEDAGVEVFSYDDGNYQKLEQALLNIQQSPAVKKVLNAGLQTTSGTMRNLVNTTALVTESVFLNVCDDAYMRTVSGAFSYNEAILSAVGQIGSSGAFVYYPTGHRDRIDVAVRRAVLSGLGKTIGKLNEILCDEMGCDLVEVTAHWNARPSHAEWQGLVYSRSGKNKNYPDFAICGYGTGEGLLGWNCYHDFHPFFEGISERNYTDSELERMKNNTVTYNGKNMTGYEATKVQRSIERNIRDSKRKLIAYDQGMKNATGELKDEFQLRYTLEKNRLTKLNEKLDDFCKQTGFQKQYDRARVQGFGGSQAQKAVQTGKKGLTSGVKSGMINTQGGKIMNANKIDSPIEQRNTAKGNPNAILQWGRPLNNRQRQLLEQLPEYDSQVVVLKKSVNMKDLAALTAQTGDEFALFTKGNQRLIIRGNYQNVNVNENMANRLSNDGYRWSGHTHPGVDDFVLTASDGDRLILKCFQQNYTVIYNSKGSWNVIEKEE